MRLANFREDILFGIGDELGIDTANDINDEHARAWARFANTWLRRAWNYWDWPELAVTEERAFRTIWGATKQFRRRGIWNAPDELYYLADGLYYAVLSDAPGDPPIGTLPTDTTYFAEIETLDRYIELDQQCRRSIGTVFGVYQGNPRLNPNVPGVEYRPSEKGIDIAPGYTGATVFVHYRIRPGALSAIPYNAATVYSPRAVVLWSDGQCYRNLVKSLGIDPTNISYWAVVPVPQTLVPYVVKRAAADAADDIQTKATLIDEAEDLLTQECNLLLEQGQPFQYKARRTYVPCGTTGSWWNTTPAWTLNGSTEVTTLSELCEDEGFIDMSQILSQSEGAVSQLTIGEDFYVVVFAVEKNTVNYDFGELIVENLVDAGSASKLAVSGIINKTTTGFTVLLSGSPDTANYYLRWRVGLIE